MRKLFSLIVLLSLTCYVKAQSVAINTDGSNPDTSAILDVKSTTKGMLIPRLTATQKNAIVSPATGLLVYQTNSTPGFYYYSGSAWVAVSPKGVNKTLSNLSPTAVNQSLIPGVTNSVDLGSDSLAWRNVFIGGNVGIGTNAPRMPLHISSATGYGMVIENPVALNTGVTSGLYFKTSNQYYGIIKAIGTSINSGRLGFYTYSSSDSTALFERLSITDGGFVGINTTAPTQQLEVNGSTKVDGNLNTTGGVTTGTTLNVGTTATISGNLTVNGAASVSGSATLSGGAAVTGALTDGGLGVVVGNSGTQMKVVTYSATLSVTNLAPNTLLGAVGHIGIAAGVFSGTPTAYIGNISANENGDYYRVVLIPDNVTTTGVDIKLFNPTASTISFSNVTWKVLVIGPK